MRKREYFTERSFLAACILMLVASMLPKEYYDAHMLIGVAAILVFGGGVFLDWLR